MRTIITIIVATMLMAACHKETNTNTITQKEVAITFIADTATSRTTVDTSGDTPLFSWDSEESFVVLEQSDVLAKASTVSYERIDGKAHITATFTANAGKDAYEYVTIYPESNYVEAESIHNATLTLPAIQTMAEESYDPAADLMVSMVVEAYSQPTTSQMVRFTRLAAIVKMSLKNFNIGQDEAVESVIFKADGHTLAGEIYADLANPHEYTVAEGYDSITTTTSAADDIYFTVLPTTLNGGDSYTITVVTSKRLYVKEGTIPTDRSLTFAAGMVSRFGVDMSSATLHDKWALVCDASTLAVGDEVIITALEYDKAMARPTSTSVTSYPATDIVKMGDVIYGIDDSKVLVFSLKEGKTGLENFKPEKPLAFGFTFDNTTYYLSTNDQHELKPFNRVNAAMSTFDVNITSSGDATIQSSYAIVKFDSTNGTQFTAYQPTKEAVTAAENAVAIYKRAK